MNENPSLFEGKALLASPHMDDPHFEQTVVYIVRHSSEDAFGLIVNRPTDHTLPEVLETAADARLERDGFLHFGGPVDGPLVALHDQPDLSDMPCHHGVFLTTDKDRLLPLLKRSDARIKLLAGFSGWSAGQLESEMETGSWLITDVSVDDILGVREGLWRELLFRVGHGVYQHSGFELTDPKRAHWN